MTKAQLGREGEVFMGTGERTSQVLCLLSLLSLLLTLTSPVGAQSEIRLRIEAVNSALFPQVEAYVSVSNAQGLPVRGLTAADFFIAEDGKPVAQITVTATQNIKQPLAFALIIDTSGSMASGRPSAMQKAIEAAKAFTDMLAVQDALAILPFSSTVSLAQELTTDRSLAQAALSSLKAEGGTAIYDAIVKAVGVLKNRPERRVIILLTDGRDTDSKYTAKDAVDEAVRWSVPVYPIGFGDVDRRQLEGLAELTGGSAQIKPDSSALQDAFKTTLQMLREQYLIRYTSALAADDLQHKLTVAVNYGGLHVEESQRFVATRRECKIDLPGYTDGQVVTGKIRFAAAVNCPAPPVRLDISIDGTVVQSISTAPYEYEWDTTTATVTNHQLKFTATDAANNFGEMSLNLSVMPPVTVQIKSPTAGTTISETLVMISAQVTALTSLDKVEFRVDDVVLQTLHGPPYEVQWGLSQVLPGTHVISVVASDTNGFIAKDQINVIVPPPGPSMVWIVLIAFLAAVILIIPIANHQRRRARSQEAVVATPEKPGLSVLRELEGLNPDHVWPLEAEMVWLGRKREDNDIPLKGQNASRHHAVIRLYQGQHFIYSRNAENPVLVNDVPVDVNQPQLLQPGDRIRAGESLFVYEIQNVNGYPTSA